MGKTGPKPRPIIVRLEENIVRDPETGCWVWHGHFDTHGYGRLNVRHYKTGKKWPRQAYRLTYEHFVGEVPNGLELDHKCRNRRCVNPWHLEAVTHKENCLRGINQVVVNARKTHCSRGHPFVGGNFTTYTYLRNGRAKTSRKCMICSRITCSERYYRTKRAA